MIPRSSEISQTRSNASFIFSASFVADLVAAPEEPAEILHPFEVRDGDAAGVREDVGQDRDAPLGEDRVGLERGRAVRAFRDQPRLDPVRVLLGHLILARGENENVAGKLEQLLVRDPRPRLPVLERAVLRAKSLMAWTSSPSGS